MKALVVAPHPFFSPRGTPFSVYYRTLVTAELGVEVDLLTYGEGQDVTIPGVRIIRIPRVPFTHDVPVGPSAKKLVLDVLMVVWTLWLLLRTRYDFVHAHEESVFFCRFLKPLFGFKLVYDMHSSLPQQLGNFEFTKSRFTVRLFELFENAALRAATAVITICPDLADTVQPRLQDPSSHFLIENSIFEDVSISGTAPPSQMEEAAMMSLPNSRLVVYTGTFEAYQGIDLLIKAFAKVYGQVKDTTLVMAGGTPAQVAHYRAVADSHGLNGSCVFTGRVSPSAARCLNRKATVLMSPRILGTNTPLKIYEQLASGIPIVATRIHSHTQVLDDDVCFLVEPTPEAMAEGILGALSDTARSASVSVRALALYESRYARPVYEEKMRSLLTRLR